MPEYWYARVMNVPGLGNRLPPPNFCYRGCVFLLTPLMQVCLGVNRHLAAHSLPAPLYISRFFTGTCLVGLDRSHKMERYHRVLLVYMKLIQQSALQLLQLAVSANGF